MSDEEHELSETEQQDEADEDVGEVCYIYFNF